MHVRTHAHTDTDTRTYTDTDTHTHMHEHEHTHTHTQHTTHTHNTHTQHTHTTRTHNTHTQHAHTQMCRNVFDDYCRYLVQGNKCTCVCRVCCSEVARLPGHTQVRHTQPHDGCRQTGTRHRRSDHRGDHRAETHWRGSILFFLFTYCLLFPVPSGQTATLQPNKRAESPAAYKILLTGWLL